MVHRKEGKEKADEIIPDWDIEYIKDEASKEDETQTAQPSAFGGAENGVIDDSRLELKKEANNMSGFKDKFKTFLGFMGVDMSKVPDDALPVEAPEGIATSAFTEADIETAKKEAAEAERKKVEAEFVEKTRTAAKEARRAEISTWCDTMTKEGRLTPALVKYGLPELLSFLSESDDVIEFGEEKTKGTYFDRLKGLFETELPRLANFGEIAKRGDHEAGQGTAADQLDMLTKKKMAENKELSYSAAFSDVQKEHADLVTEYQEEIAQAA